MYCYILSEKIKRKQNKNNIMLCYKKVFIPDNSALIT